MSAESLPFDLVAVAASFGGVQALSEFASALPADFPIPIVVVLHRSRQSNGHDLLAEILQYRTSLRVLSPRGCTLIQPGHIYVAPHDRHVFLAARDALITSVLPENQLWRPSADVLFGSVAQHCGARGIAVVLSGRMWDGAKGAASVKAAGGRVFVQDRATSASFAMPRAAIEAGAAELPMSPRHITAAVTALASVPGADRLFRTGECGRRWRLGSAVEVAEA